MRLHICRNCHKHLKKLGEPAIQIIETACLSFVENGLFYISSNEIGYRHLVQIVAYLEFKGYIVTTELNITDIAIVPNSRIATFIEYQENFCWCHLHQQENSYD